MINKRTGYITISPDIELAPNDSFEKISNLTAGENQDVRDMKNGYKWLDLKNVKINNDYFILSLGFFNNQFKMLAFIVDDKRFNLNDSHNTWTEEKEKRDEQKYKKWIVDNLGHEGAFPWGEVSASYDPKNGSSSIFIRYNYTEN